MRKVQVFGTILEDKGALVACEGNCEQQNSLEAQNSDTLKMLNANVNRLMKHVVDNETTKSNEHMTDTCTTTYIAHPLKSSEKKESPIKRKRRIIAEHNFSKDDMRLANELTKSISVGGLNFLHKEDKKVNVNKVYIPMNDRAVNWFLIAVDLDRRRVALLDSLPLNKSNDFRRELAKDLYYLVLQLQDCDEVEIEPEYTFPQSIVDTLNDEEQKVVYIPFKDGKVHWLLIVVDRLHKKVHILDPLRENRANNGLITLVRDLINVICGIYFHINV
ncbi:hypothetical protein Cgig2_033115 [Carnegiea gigantea]|uniref:Ubiquitin-like protease family profile domain-containing protein n=1 Tax=Carnegiea gigantea TaxID=171969 RepID=A0A9Q1K0P8_9CARY|nr:hypothetical protein Cgig2_033115 [Carnegiea gigantea]